MLKKSIAEKFLSRLLMLLIFFTLFRMHENDVATEKEFNTVLQIILERVLTQRFNSILHFGLSKSEKVRRVYSNQLQKTAKI